MNKQNLCIAIITLFILFYTTSCSLLYYSSSDEDSSIMDGSLEFGFSAEPSTESFDDHIGFIIEAPDLPETSREDDLTYQWVTKITTERLRAIPTNTSYGDILEKLGQTTAFGHSYYRQYVTDDKRVIPLLFKSKDELCPYSGEELYDRALPLDYDGGIPEGMIYGVLISDDRFFTERKLFAHYLECVNEGRLDIFEDAHGERTVVGDVILTDGAEIVFEDGTPASEDDLRAETAVFVRKGSMLEDFSGKGLNTKIVILK